MKIAINEKHVHNLDIILIKTIVCLIGGAILVATSGLSFNVQTD